MLSIPSDVKHGVDRCWRPLCRRKWWFSGLDFEARVLQEKSELHLSDNFYDNVLTNGELESNQYTSCVICLLLEGSYGSCI